jgi:hypothetical protein
VSGIPIRPSCLEQFGKNEDGGHQIHPGTQLSWNASYPRSFRCNELFLGSHERLNNLTKTWPISLRKSHVLQRQNDMRFEMCVRSSIQWTIRDVRQLSLDFGTRAGRRKGPFYGHPFFKGPLRLDVPNQMIAPSI